MRAPLSTKRPGQGLRPGAGLPTAPALRYNAWNGDAGEAAGALVRFEDVALRYGNGPEVLTDLSFRLNPGSMHFLTGPSGAGKTSLLKLLYLALRPSRGRIDMFGEDMGTLPRTGLPRIRRRIGVIFQDFRLLPHLSALDNVALPLRIQGARLEEHLDDVRELLTWVGLGDRMDALPSTLSGGEQQRVAIARAVIGRPDLILADEPTGNVDPEIGRRLMRLFVELNRLGTTVLIATHDTTLIERFAASVLALRDGRLAVPEEAQLSPAAAEIET